MGEEGIGKRGKGMREEGRWEMEGRICELRQYKMVVVRGGLTSYLVIVCDDVLQLLQLVHNWRYFREAVEGDDQVSDLHTQSQLSRQRLQLVVSGKKLSTL